MNAAHWHLVVNHIPVIGAAFLLLLAAWGLVARSRELSRAALVFTLLLGLVSYPVYLTGERAEEMVEDLAWADHDLIHEHHEQAEAGLIAIMVTGAIAGIGLWLSRGGRALPQAVAACVTLGLLASTGLFGRAAYTAGSIRHDEIGAPAPAPAAPGAEEHSH